MQDKQKILASSIPDRCQYLLIIGSHLKLAAFIDGEVNMDDGRMMDPFGRARKADGKL